MKTTASFALFVLMMGCGGGYDWRDERTSSSALSTAQRSAPIALRPEAAPRAFRSNGETCTADADCSTGFCSTQAETGELRCYGNKKANEPCLSTFDCAVGVCAPSEWPAAAGGKKACVAATESCSKPEIGSLCAELARVQCAFFRSCGLPVPNLSQCVAAGCDDIAARAETADPVDCEGRLRGLAAATKASCPR
jgi:hypothetical protein